MQRTKSQILPSYNGNSQVHTPVMQIIQEGDQILIDARQLHQQLQSGYRFTTWIQSKIADYGFMENQDFFRDFGKSTGGRPSTEILLTLDMAKELAMVERSETGRLIRRYFIECEKQLRKITVNLPTHTEALASIKPTKVSGYLMYPYREVLSVLGYSTKSSTSSRRRKYPQHFIMLSDRLYITSQFASHLAHSRAVYCNRTRLEMAQPVLPLDFGSPILSH